MTRTSWPALAAAVVLLALTVPACGDSAGDAEAAGPVITPADAWEAVPSGQVIGLLTLNDGCLLLDGEVVFWPKGTTWDAAAEAVVLGDGGPVAVGETFEGGGGQYATSTDFESLLGDEAARQVDDCVEMTGAGDVVFAYGVGDAPD